ncbi:MAG: aminotransferase class I/II-fold pyridoxal phosphate-dependent enzyme, partial [Deltaproteobacteria bacterium]|nr:aminotransferase class I/II-fold pyridoxal phosphate-dependent enzyme [Deltaproteobacteria bacterium]
MIPYGRQYIDEDDIQAVTEVLRSEWLTQGPNTVEFESALCEIVGAGYAVAVNSGTSALHIACLAAGVKDGDEIITSSITFVASANCTVYCGGKPVFADIDPKTYNISPGEIEKRITDKTKAIIPVHFAGQSCDMEAIQQIVNDAEKKYGHKIYIIEDACHALGSKYKGNEAGSCEFSDMAVMSFHPVKHITTGEGGVVFTNDEKLDMKLKRLRSHGITSDPEEFFSKDLAFQPSAFSLQPSVNPWYYEQQVIGYNYRITNIQCALGLSQ